MVVDRVLDRRVISSISALAITIANPTDLVKVRLQAKGKLPPGVPRRYSGALNAYDGAIIKVNELKCWNSACYPLFNHNDLGSFQSGCVECGFYKMSIMRYMRDIAENGLALLKNNFMGKEIYEDAKVDEVKVEWAMYETNFL
ncbi:hypothetical protein Patl1_35112 [Pistacia atlantica]|uniref:Uncharacterized protein n=1 Tax=Pistacia atlantica TaxID=434234 RepID=A0ACC0ZRF8_9ROSI|nr:hypothetical protein Patl1_35112 [Pistacia atlantica]